MPQRFIASKKIMNNRKKHRSESEDESATDVAET